VPFRFVHTADIHLDSPLKSLALRDRELAELIGNATRRAFVNIIELCLAEQVDALLLAGDLYDGDQTSMKTARFLAEQMRRLDAAGIAVFVIRGNHDALSRITRELTLPESVKIFGGRAEVVTVAPQAGDLAVAVHGISFAQPHAPDSLLPKYKPPFEGAVNIALLHTSLGGVPGHDRYAPCSIAELDAAGMNYWALGHIHKRLVAGRDGTIVMPGMPQGRDINEAGPKSVSLVTIADDRSMHVEERMTSVAQFERVNVDLTGVAQWSDVVKTVGARLAALRSDVAAEHVVARLRFDGVTPLAWQLRRDADMLKAEADDRGFAVGKTWIEAVEVECHAPLAGAAGSADPLAELRTLIEQDIVAAPAYRTEIAEMADELRLQLPPECRAFLGQDEEDFARRLMDLAREGAEDVLARLQASAAPETR
jgi:DNA repair exonuclease SbcCD nuclease subunit